MSKPPPYIDFDNAAVVYAPDDQRVLCRQEVIILRELTKRPGRLVPLERLIEALYAHESTGGARDAKGVIKVRISRLRKVLPWPIVVRYGLGYRIEGYPT
jgi:DNA-binding response OmpR family regulator